MAAAGQAVTSCRSLDEIQADEEYQPGEHRHEHENTSDVESVGDGTPGRRADETQDRSYSADDTDLERAEADLLQEHERERDDDAESTYEREVEEFDGNQVTFAVTQVGPAPTT